MSIGEDKSCLENLEKHMDILLLHLNAKNPPIANSIPTVIITSTNITIGWVMNPISPDGDPIGCSPPGEGVPV